jgi:hypothetical protein
MPATETELFGAKESSPRKELLSFFLLIRSRVLEPDLRADGGAEIVARTGVQEHDFITSLHPETEPPGIELNAAARIEDAIRIAINNIVDLVIDNSRSHRTANAEVHKTAFQ